MHRQMALRAGTESAQIEALDDLVHDRSLILSPR
jgi:hypothetical protein